VGWRWTPRDTGRGWGSEMQQGASKGEGKGAGAGAGAFGQGMLERKKSNSLDGIPQEVQWALVGQASGAGPPKSCLRRERSESFDLLALGHTASDTSVGHGAQARYTPAAAPAGRGAQGTPCLRQGTPLALA